MRLPLTFALGVKPGSVTAKRVAATNSSKLRNFSSASPPKYYLLSYTYNPENLLERRAPHRPAHLLLAKEYVASGKLLLGGAYADPIDGAALVFHGSQKDVEEFVRRDPYVQKGIVTSHSVREWTVLVGSKLV